MNTQTVLSLLRTLLKIGGTYLCTKGLTDSATWETVVGGLTALVGIVTTVIWHTNPDNLAIKSATPTQVVNAQAMVGQGAGAQSILRLLIFVPLMSLFFVGCTTALRSDKIITCKERCFGLIVNTTSTADNTPSIKFGFTSTVIQMLPTSTNQLYSANFADTFWMNEGLNPFATDVSENTATGNYQIGTNGQAQVIIPKVSRPIFQPITNIHTGLPNQ